MALKSLKCVVLGDGTVGKTCLLMRYTTDEFLSDYVPTVFENYAASTLVGDEVYDVHLFDTAGQEAYNHLRKLTLEQADVIVVCFSVDLWNSFINVKEKWIPELQEHYSKIPFMVVGTKIDLRFDTDTIEKLTAQGRKPITKEEGEVLAKELSANAYLECSALTRENVDSVFKEALQIAVSQREIATPKEENGKKCSPCCGITNRLHSMCTLM
ncbi:hypothetical protein PPYR_09457 [Photinus pyralis]|uniref:Uncharacterized protein n=2 Tax=Photinus pyralis TaxID=7054 RepID=A0A5N4AMC8_PHOPY|nr:cdc42 homolog isoform X1 [Photinus pyralis]KAB0798464.1 hypothetical protein PPYR_09457 [Photinus pyralis]